MQASAHTTGEAEQPDSPSLSQLKGARFCGRAGRAGDELINGHASDAMGDVLAAARAEDVPALLTKLKIYRIYFVRLCEGS